MFDPVIYKMVSRGADTNFFPTREVFGPRTVAGRNTVTWSVVRTRYTVFCILRCRRLPRSTALEVEPSRRSSRKVRAFSRSEDRSFLKIGPNPLQRPTWSRSRASFAQGRLGATPAVEQAVDLLHDPPEGSQSRQTPGDAPQRPPLIRREVVPHEQMTMLEQVPDLPIEVPSPPDLPFRLRCDGAPAGKLRLLRRQALADLSDGAEDRLVQFRQDVEPADLMLHGAEDLGNRLRIELRAVGGDPAKGQPSAGQGRAEAAEEPPDIPLSRVVVEDP